MSKTFMQLRSERSAERGARQARERRQKLMENWEGALKPGTRAIPLTKGYWTIVSECDYDYLMQWNWRFGCKGYVIKSEPRIKGQPRKNTYMHVLIANPPLGKQADHKDRNTLNNCRDNLRICTPTQNQGNRGKRQDAIGSKFKGVCYDKFRGKFVATGATIRNGKRTSMLLGRYDKETDAAKCYNSWASSYFGEFANLNVM